MRGKEDSLQMACVKWFDLQWGRYRQLLYHIPNGGSRNAIEGAKFKAMGVRRGIADLALDMPGRGYHGLRIELKTPTGRQSAEQKEYQARVQVQGYKYSVVRTFGHFKALVNWYLGTLSDEQYRRFCAENLIKDNL